MGIKSFVKEYKCKASASRMFKALILKGHEEIPKFMESMKNLELVGGGDVKVGSIWKVNFPEGSHFKHMKHRIDEIDAENYFCKFTMIEGDVLGDKLEKVCYHLKFEPSNDGGCVVKITSEYHSKDGVELNEDEIKAGKEQSVTMYKACDEYLVANPNVCA